jgi:hypothetical protein
MLTLAAESEESSTEDVAIEEEQDKRVEDDSKDQPDVEDVDIEEEGSKGDDTKKEDD